MITRPPRSTRPDTLFPSTTLVRSGQDKGTGPTSCTDLAVRQLLVGQDLARGPADLAPGAAVAHDDVAGSLGRGRRGLGADHVLGESQVPHHAPGHLVAREGLGSRQVPRARQIGKASCRESGCQYVYISVGAVSLKKNKTHIITISTCHQQTNIY